MNSHTHTVAQSSSNGAFLNSDDKVTPPPDGVLPAEHAFNVWATNVKSLGELNATSVSKYRPLWMAWLSWCMLKNIPWDGIQVQDIQNFLDGPAPGQGITRRRAINPERMSSHTRQRYFRLLFGVYTSANKNKLLEHNPAMDLDQEDRPSVPDNDRQSQVLEPFLFDQLASKASIEELFPHKTDANWWYARDRAIMAVLIETGITVTELIALRGVDLVEDRAGRAVADPSVQTSLLSGDTGLLLDIMENSQSVGRTLPIRFELAPLLRAWLAWRQRLLNERSAMIAPLSQRDSFMKVNGHNGPLFFSRRAREGSEAFPPMDATSVYHSVSLAIQRIRKIRGMEAVTYVAKGPAVVRNTVIRRWIDEFGAQEAATMAGLKSAHSLRLK